MSQVQNIFAASLDTVITFVGAIRWFFTRGITSLVWITIVLLLPGLAFANVVCPNGAHWPGWTLAASWALGLTWYVFFPRLFTRLCAQSYFDWFMMSKPGQEKIQPMRFAGRRT